MAVDVQEDGQEIAPLVAVGGDDAGHHQFVGGFPERGPGPGRLIGELHLVADGADFEAGAATCALGRVYETGLLL